MTTQRRFFQWRKQAESINSAAVAQGLPAPIPNYSRMRKDELERKVKHYEKNISACRRFHSFYEEEGE